MKDADFVDLANRVIDGVGSEHDRAALDAVLRDSTQRRLEYEQLSAVASILDAVRPIEPPVDLRDKILARIPVRAAAAPRREGLSSMLRRLGESFVRRPVTSLGYAIAAGLVVGVALSPALPRFDANDPNVFGTIGVASGHVQDSEVVQTEGVRVEAVLARDGDRVALELTVDADRPIDVQIDAGSPISWHGVETDAKSGFSSVDVAGSSIRISGVVDGHYVVSGRNTGAMSAFVGIEGPGGSGAARVQLSEN